MGANLPKNLIKEMVKENQFQNVGDIYTYFKGMFNYTIQEMLEAEPDVSLGYQKNDMLINICIFSCGLIFYVSRKNTATE